MVMTIERLKMMIDDCIDDGWMTDDD